MIHVTQFSRLANTREDEDFPVAQNDRMALSERKVGHGKR